MAGRVVGDGACERFTGDGGVGETLGVESAARVARWRETFPPIQVGVPAVLRDALHTGDGGEFHRGASFRRHSRGTPSSPPADRGRNARSDDDRGDPAAVIGGISVASVCDRNAVRGEIAIFARGVCTGVGHDDE